MKRIFSQHIFNYRVFNSFNPQESRNEKIGRMQKLIEKGVSQKELERLGFSDCLGEVKTYSTENSGWDDRFSSEPTTLTKTEIQERKLLRIKHGETLVPVHKDEGHKPVFTKSEIKLLRKLRPDKEYENDE